MTGVSVFIPSFNKGPYVLDAINSVLAQTREDWEIWLLENSNDDGRTRECIELSGILGDSRIHYEKIDDVENIRRDYYITCWLLNRYMGEAAGEYIFYLSDDDLIDPTCLERMTAELDPYPGRNAAYASLRHAYGCAPGEVGPFGPNGIPAETVRMHPENVDCRIDGGQVMFRRTLLNSLPYPWYTESNFAETARHCDGIFLQNLLKTAEAFWPVNEWLITHRHLASSVWTRG